jgi:hypothetical protein
VECSGLAAVNTDSRRGQNLFNIKNLTRGHSDRDEPIAIAAWRLSLGKSELRNAAFATGMTALAVHVRRLFHRFALRAAIFLTVAYIAAAIGMSAFLVIGHWWLLSSEARFFPCWMDGEISGFQQTVESSSC